MKPLIFNVISIFLFLQINTALAIPSSKLLIEAAKKGDLDQVNSAIVGLKIKSIMAVDNQGWSALHWASYNDNVQLLKVLIAAGADINQGTENKACLEKSGCMSGVKHLFKKVFKRLIKRNQIQAINNAEKSKSTAFGVTALNIAARGNHFYIVKELIKAGVKVNQSDSLGVFPLLNAAANGHIPIVKLLLNSNASINQTDINGWTPLHYAAVERRPVTTKLLLDSNANVNQANFEGSTALQLAASEGSSLIVQILLDFGADLNIPDKDGWTPLHLAVQNGHVTVAKILLSAGAKIDQKTINDETESDIAERIGHIEIVEILKKPEDFDYFRVKFAAKLSAWKILQTNKKQMLEKCIEELNATYGSEFIKGLIGTAGNGTFEISKYYDETIGLPGFELVNHQTRLGLSQTKLIKGCLAHFKAVYEQQALARASVERRVNDLASRIFFSSNDSGNDQQICD
jgi:ankyrin repeat protein